jgi:hypothetical protein
MGFFIYFFIFYFFWWEANSEEIIGTRNLLNSISATRHSELRPIVDGIHFLGFCFFLSHFDLVCLFLFLSFAFFLN